ncbi:4-hydroxy-tetrahydrodipicolinate synthase [Anaerobacillus arseniciselenatis]|uniref:4-hydroxy-tetrahydrodipicolinate synthase n=1 Tax=Anaerobacillus arseniciselenatis TaxID=85682 RepID=A0A1S2LGB1_9BACI|nr:4-hydroxy-tetrahydrodipicolinate synthase [Anaerobacillus arseniciselenatis]OIJ11579.1 4-hydroxy-tetrahydrodipicolinate synthase [Anaerobacillus arseniciselenatis]
MIHGVIPAVLTPFTTSGEVNEKALREYVDFLIDKGVHGLFPLGTNGSGPLMSVEDRKKVISIVVEQTNKRVPVIVHTGAISTSETIEVTLHAENAGADAAAIVTPWYFPHDDVSLQLHFSAVAEAVPNLPIYLYNIPGNAKNELKPKLMKKLADQHANIKGIKDSSKDLARLQDYIATLGEGYDVVVGTDALVYPALAMGATGVVSAVGNCFPEIMVELYEAYNADDLTEAKKLQYRANQVRDALKLGSYITPYYEALKLRGIDVGEVKLPLRPLTETEKDNLKTALTNLNLL